MNRTTAFKIKIVMNYQPCISAMKWFRESVSFSKDYGDIPKQLLEYAEDSNMLQAIVSYAKQADVGIEDMTFEVSNEELSQSKLLFENIPEGILRALKEFAAALKDSSDTAEMNLRVGELKTSSLHRGIKKDGRMDMFSLELADESDGTRRLHSGVSELFNLTDFPVRTNDNIRKAYLAGKYGAVPEVDTVEVE